MKMAECDVILLGGGGYDAHVLIECHDVKQLILVTYREGS